MDDAQFLKELTAFDPGIADRWKNATGGKISAKIDQKEVLVILKPLFDAGKITAGQAKAINHIWIWTWEKFTERAIGALYINIEDAYLFDLFFAGSNVQLASATQLKEFDAAIGAASGVIDFTSPQSHGTGLSYSSGYYAAIKRLVTDGQIKVFEVDAAGLHAKAGLYRSDIDRLVLYKGLPASLTQWTTVHEVTHAIQDWRNVVANHEYTEADAYVAAATAALAVSEAALDAMSEYPAQKDAARLVLGKKANSKNSDWVHAYAAVVRAVKKDPIYKGVIGKKFNTKLNEKGKDEKKILSDLMQQMAQPTAPPAQTSQPAVNRPSK